MRNKRTQILFLLLLIISGLAFYYHQTKQIRVFINSPFGIGNHSKNLGFDDKTRQKIQAYIENVSISATENNLAYAIRLDHGVGHQQILSENYKAAYNTYLKVLAISYQHGNRMGVGVSLGVLSSITSWTGDFDQAIDLAFIQYKVAQGLNNRFETGVVEFNIGNLLDHKDKSMGMAWKLRAYKSLKGTPHKDNYSMLLVELSKDYESLGDFKRSMAMVKEAWKVAELSGQSSMEKNARLLAANAYTKLLAKTSQCQQVINLVNKATLQIKEKEKTNASYFALLSTTSNCYRQLNQNSLAKQYALKAYNYYQLARHYALGDEARARLDQKNRGLINQLINVYLQEEDYYTALALLETNKARTLADISEDPEQQTIYSQLTNLRRKHAEQRTTFFTEKKESTINDSLEAESLNTISSQNDSKLWDHYSLLLKQQEKQIKNLQTSLKIRNVSIGSEVSSQKIRKIQSRLSKNTAILSIYAQEKSLSYFLLTKNNLRYFKSATSYPEVSRAIRELQVALTNPYFDYYKQPIQKLSDALIKPIQTDLEKNITTLIYSPDGLFSVIPLGVLSLNKHYLAEQLSIVQIPSLRAVSETENKQVVVSQGIICVDPALNSARLPFQSDTGKMLEKLFQDKTTSLFAENCTPAKLEQAIKSIDHPAFLHIGAHGSYYADDPMRSGLYLSSENLDNQGVLWDANAIGSINLNKINLITLASCKTGLIDSQYSRDIFGIQRTLIFSGAQAVIAPLWSVYDQSTSELMQQFYHSYAAGDSPRLSLQKSQQKMIKTKQYSHPYYWSGFVLTRAMI